MTISRLRNLITLPSMNLVMLNRIPILQQLHLEERLLRTSSDNWCIINDGTNDPTIVMGVSGKPAQLLEIKPVLRDKIPVIRRFTGGGTVIVDHGTVFVSFICNKDAVSCLQPFPQPIMAWTSLLYDQVFHEAGDYKLRENGMKFELFVIDVKWVLVLVEKWLYSYVFVIDYVFGNRKFGGNAQSITKNRWIHHTSFLWDYDDRNMTYLKNPKRAPEYRLARNHSDFICRIKEILPRPAFIERTIKAAEHHFSLKSISPDSVASSATANFTPSSRVLTSQELEGAVLDKPEVLLNQSL
ncbi:hypothetical protein KSS87_016694 [Heliosperma pusillum]|nr:hypothetical protein KSS87_000682 [Heliosperma pusillum]KAH9622947.1 hypothetical protein KSS87_016694 [Heliosperma pusillum]